MANIRSSYTDSINFFGNETPQSLAKEYGTPLYVYNENVLRKCCKDMVQLCENKHLKINYSAKANTNPHLLQIIKEEGCLVDAMSPGELLLNLKAGYSSQDILYVCNNVGEEEIKFALSHNVLVSVDSLSQIETVCALNKNGKIMVRFNPGVGAGHSAKVLTGGKDTKFGVDPEKLPQVLELLAKYNVKLAGINHHIGSLFMDGAAYMDAAQVLLDIATTLPNLNDLEIIDFGGGFGIPYEKYTDALRFDLKEFGTLLNQTITKWSEKNQYMGVFYLEPGRYIVAESGLVLGTVHSTKTNGANHYVGTDIGFNVLARPMLYDSFHDVEIYRENGQEDTTTLEQTIVGNICESGDILAKKRQLPPMKKGDIMAMLDAGAYGFVMSSNYNHRLKPAEVLIQKDGTARLIRKRETLNDIFTSII